MITSHHTNSHSRVINDGPYCDWLHSDWPSLMTLLWLIVWWLIIIDYPTVTARWLTIIDLTYCDWLHSDWPPLMTLLSMMVSHLAVTIGSSMMVSHHTITVKVGSSMMDSHCAISHSWVINDSQSPCNHSPSNHWWPYCVWLYGDWSSLITLLWLWLHGDWPSLMTLL
jgi:hypothetical protein